MAICCLAYGSFALCRISDVFYQDFRCVYRFNNTARKKAVILEKHVLQHCFIAIYADWCNRFYLAGIVHFVAKYLLNKSKIKLNAVICGKNVVYVA